MYEIKEGLRKKHRVCAQHEILLANVHVCLSVVTVVTTRGSRSVFKRVRVHGRDVA